VRVGTDGPSPRGSRKGDGHDASARPRQQWDQGAAKGGVEIQRTMHDEQSGEGANRWVEQHPREACLFPKMDTSRQLGCVKDGRIEQGSRGGGGKKG
jgi:hypothetical protein